MEPSPTTLVLTVGGMENKWGSLERQIDSLSHKSYGDVKRVRMRGLS